MTDHRRRAHQLAYLFRPGFSIRKLAEPRLNLVQLMRRPFARGAAATADTTAGSAASALYSRILGRRWTRDFAHLLAFVIGTFSFLTGPRRLLSLSRLILSTTCGRRRPSHRAHLRCRRRPLHSLGVSCAACAPYLASQHLLLCICACHVYLVSLRLLPAGLRVHHRLWVARPWRGRSVPPSTGIEPVTFRNPTRTRNLPTINLVAILFLRNGKLLL